MDSDSKMLKQICTTPQCDAGGASVNEMDSVYQGLPINIQAQFQSAHDSIMSAFHSYWIGIDRWIPFNPACCAIESLGKQADTLVCNMQLTVGQVQSCEGPSTQSAANWTSLLIAGGVLFAGFFFLEGRRTA